jgi:hypothetical protein
MTIRANHSGRDGTALDAVDCVQCQLWGGGGPNQKSEKDMSISLNQHRTTSIDLECDGEWIELCGKDKDGNTLQITFFTRTSAIELLHDLASQIRRALRDEYIVNQTDQILEEEA